MSIPVELPPWQGEVPAEDSFGDAWGLKRINTSAAWQVTKGNPSVLVAVVDSGCNAEVADLAGQVAGQWDVLDQDPVAQDDNGHGTMLATIVAGLDDGTGSVGVAPGVKLLCVKVCSSAGISSYSDLAEGISWAADQGASVILVGHGGFGNGEGLAALKEAILEAAAADAVVVAPAGSGGGANLDQFPAAWSDWVVGVAAGKTTDRPSADTDISPTTSFLAPGEAIVGTDPDGDVVMQSGSSVAAALVAGAAALVRSAGPQLDAAASRGVLHGTASPLPIEDFDRIFSARVPDVGAAVAAAAGGLADAGIVRIDLAPSTPLPGQKAVVRVMVENRGAVLLSGANVTLGVAGGTAAPPGKPGGAQTSQPVGNLLPGDSAELVWELVPESGGFLLTASVAATGDAKAANDTLELEGKTAASPVHSVRIVRAELAPPEAKVPSLEASAVVENNGNATEPARTLSVVLWPQGTAADVEVPELAPGERVSLVTAIGGIGQSSEPRGHVDFELSPASGQLDLSKTFAVFRLRRDAAAGWAQQAYIQLPGENLIADAPWRSIQQAIPVLVFYARTHWTESTEDEGEGNALVGITTVSVRNPAGPFFSDITPPVYLDRGDALPVVIPDGAYVWNEGGGGVWTNEVLEALTPADGSHRVLWLQEAGLPNEACLDLPSTGCGHFLDVKFSYGKLQVQYWVDDVTRRMLGVNRGNDPPPRLHEEDHYFDAHFHTIAEWYRGSNPVGPAKAYGGPLIMATATGHALGFLQSPELDPTLTEGRIITTDHNTFFDDWDAPDWGPTSQSLWLDGLETGSGEFDVYRFYFGEGAAEEVTTSGNALDQLASMLGGVEALGSVLGRHMLTYRSKHVEGDWGWLGGLDDLIVAKYGGEPLCTPSYQNLVLRVACNPGVAGECGGGDKCIGGDAAAPEGFMFAAHPFLNGFLWNEESLRDMLSLKAPPGADPASADNDKKYLTQEANPGGKGDFVVRGIQLWNTRPSRKGSLKINYRAINPFAGAVMDPPDAPAETWAPVCDEYREKLLETAKAFLILARDGLSYTLQNEEKPRTQFIRKVFHVAGSDAHGDFNYGTDIVSTKVVGAIPDWLPLWSLGVLDIAQGTSDNAYGRPATYVFASTKDGAGTPTATMEDVKHGHTTATDGPVLELMVDPEARGSYDKDTGAVTWHDGEKKFEDGDGMMGGDGFRDGGRTALVPMVAGDPKSQRIMVRLRCKNIGDFGGDNVAKAELWVSGPADSDDEPESIDLAGFQCDDQDHDYQIQPAYDPKNPSAMLDEPIAVMAHVQIGDTCPGTYDAWTNPVWIAPMRTVAPVKAVKVVQGEAEMVELMMDQETLSDLSIDIIFPVTMSNQQVDARVLQIDSKTGQLLPMSGGVDGEGKLLPLGGLDNGWGDWPKTEDPGETLRTRLSLWIPKDSHLKGVVTTPNVDDERFVLVVSKFPMSGEEEVASCIDARLCDTFGNPLGVPAIRFKPMVPCEQKACASDFKFCKSTCKCEMAKSCPIGTWPYGSGTCCAQIDPMTLMCLVVLPKEDVYWKFCPLG
jgi:hypothetical protein